MTRTGTGLLLAYVIACGDSHPSFPVRLVATPSGSDTRLTLVPATGLQLNARIAPALELTGGAVIRFHASRLTPDSSYFADPPEALLSGPHRPIHGRLRASVCDSGAAVCRTIEAEL